MPNILDANGLQTATYAELLALYTAAFEAIYGADIDLDSDTPDGQMINAFIQAVVNVEALLTAVYTGFDPDQAFGNTLDLRCAINGIQRQAGTFTVTNITLVVSQSVNLFGLDQTLQPVFTVSDASGNQFQLQQTQLGVLAGTHVFTFQSAVAGAVLTIPNTITVPVTIVLGITSINNPTTYISLGVNEETDAALKIRRQKSVSLSSQGYFNSLFAALLNIPGLSFAFIEENDTGATNGDGVPGHSIWVIVSGTGTDAAVANAIYVKRNAGCGMYNSGGPGAKSLGVVQADGSTFIVYWDTVVTVPLFIKFTAVSLNKTTPPNIAAIRAGLPGIFIPGVAAQVNTNGLTTAVQELDPNTLVTTAGFSLSAGGAYTSTLTPVTKNKQFVVTSADTIILSMILASTAGVVGIVYNINPSTGVVTNTTLTIVHANTFQFLAQGGFGAYTYSVVTSTGSTINSLSGLYTAGTAGTDTVNVVDSLGNAAFCTVTIT